VTDEPVVSGVRASAYTIPTDGPEADGTLEWDHTTLVLVEADGGGRTGIGWTYAPTAAAVVVDDLLGPVVTGRPALAVEAAWSAMVRAVRNAGRPGLVGMALSAVDIALWDLAGRLRGQSLPELWGATPAPVELYGSGGFTTYDDDRLHAQVAGWLEAGFDKVKIKVGESWGSRVERDLARTAQVRRLADEPVGERVEVFVDANGGYDRDQACEVGARLDDLGVSWFEEPVSSDDHDGLDAVRSSVRADVAAGEYGSDLAHAVHNFLSPLSCPPKPAFGRRRMRGEDRPAKSGQSRTGRQPWPRLNLRSGICKLAVGNLRVNSARGTPRYHFDDGHG
jgi:L-alanine-DL-glutamate epimerase-like enolase superfamily enzyme